MPYIFKIIYVLIGYLPVSQILECYYDPNIMFICLSYNFLIKILLCYYGIIMSKSRKVGFGLCTPTIFDYEGIAAPHGHPKQFQLHCNKGRKTEKKEKIRKESERPQPVHPFSSPFTTRRYRYAVGLLILHNRDSSEMLISPF